MVFLGIGIDSQLLLSVTPVDWQVTLVNEGESNKMGRGV